MVGFEVVLRVGDSRGNCCKSYEAKGDWWICIMVRFVICIDDEILFGCSNQKGSGGRRVWTNGRVERQYRNWWVYLR